MIVGKFVGTGALAAVGSTGTIMFLIYGFVVGMTAGFTVLTAQKFGAGDMHAMRRTVAGASILSLIIGAVLTAVFMILMKPWLTVMNTPEDIFADAYAYIMIISGGILAQMLYNLLASILRALGNSKVPLYFLILSALLNIVLDLVLIIVFHMGAAGAAVATVISQGVSGLLCLVYIIKKVPMLRMTREDWHPSGALLKTQIRIGIPMALQYSITAIGTMMVQSSLNILGSTLVAAYTAAGKIEQVVTQAYVAMGTTMATYGAPEYGGGQCAAYPAGIQSMHGHRNCLCSRVCSTCYDSREIHDISVCIRGCGSDHGFREHISVVRRYILYPPCGRQYLQERNPGSGIRPASYDGGRSRTGGKRRRRGDRGRPEELSGRVSGEPRQPGCLPRCC